MPDRSLRLVLAGWATFLMMCALVVLVRGADHVANMVVFAAVGVAMGAWLLFRRSRAALVTSLVLGVLHLLQSVAYVIAGMTDDPVDTAVVLVDVVGVASGVLITAGAAAALATRRRSPDAVPA